MGGSFRGGHGFPVKPDAQVVDGQQRLTTLTILLATLRELVPIEHANELTNFLYQKGSLLSCTSNRYRLTFALTTQVLQEDEWTPTVIERRHKKLIAVLKQVWRL